MAWGIVAFDPTNVSLARAGALARLVNVHIICYLSDPAVPPTKFGVMTSSGLTFIAIRSDGVYQVLSDIEARALLQALAAAIGF